MLNGSFFSLSLACQGVLVHASRITYCGRYRDRHRNSSKCRTYEVTKRITQIIVDKKGPDNDDDESQRISFEPSATYYIIIYVCMDGWMHASCMPS